MPAGAELELEPASSEQAARHISSLPQHKLVRIPLEGKKLWVYADAEFCRCMYVGSEAAHDRYQQLLMQQIKREAAAEMDWHVLGDGEATY